MFVALEMGRLLVLMELTLATICLMGKEAGTASIWSVSLGDPRGSKSAGAELVVC